MAGYRKEKLEAEIRRVIADTFLKEIKDPRIGFLTVTGVKLSKDYTTARVGISVIGDDREKKLSLAGAESAAGYIQHIVGKAIRMRVVPRIFFQLDSSIEDGMRVTGLIDGLSSKNDVPGDEDGTPE